MQILATIRYHLTPVRITIIKETTNNNAGDNVEKSEPLGTVGGNVMQNSMEVSLKINK